LRGFPTILKELGDDPHQSLAATVTVPAAVASKKMRVAKKTAQNGEVMDVGGVEPPSSTAFHPTSNMLMVPGFGRFRFRRAGRFPVQPPPLND